MLYQNATVSPVAIISKFATKIQNFGELTKKYDVFKFTYVAGPR